MAIIDQMFPYSATTRAITVRVAPRFLPDQSDIRIPRYVWGYHVRIENNGLVAVRLLTRHWEITDAAGTMEMVDGDGVVGQQPRIEPGQAFDYMSGCPLATSSGRMVGHYLMDSEAGRFEALIPAFPLEIPRPGKR